MERGDHVGCLRYYGITDALVQMKILGFVDVLRVLKERKPQSTEEEEFFSVLCGKKEMESFGVLVMECGGLLPLLEEVS